MRKIKTLFFVAIATTLALSTSATTVPTTVEPTTTEVKVVEPVSKTYSYKELKSLSEDKLGRKLTGKEKIVLRLSKGKLNKAFSKMPKGGGDKSQLIATLLCFFLGGLGIHDFYLGHTWSGIGKLILLITGFILIIPFIALYLWVLIDLVLIIIGKKKPKNGDYDPAF